MYNHKTACVWVCVLTLLSGVVEPERIEFDATDIHNRPVQSKRLLLQRRKLAPKRLLKEPVSPAAVQVALKP